VICVRRAAAQKADILRACRAVTLRALLVQFRVPIVSSVPYVRLSAFYFAYFAYVGAFTPFFSLYLQRDLALPGVEIGIILAVMALARILVPLLVGPWADRSGHRAGMLRISMALGAIAWTGALVADSFIGMLVVIGVFSAVIAPVMPIFEGITFSHVRDHPGRYGPVRLWGSIGFVITVLAVGPLLDMYPIRLLLWLLLAVLVSGALMAFSVPEPVAVSHAAERGGVWRVLARPQVAALFTACFLMSVAHGPFYGFYSIYLAQAGYSKTAVGVLWSLGVVAEIFVFLLSPRLFRRFSSETLLKFAFACAVLRFAAIGWLADSVSVIVIAQLLHAATFGAHHAASIGLVSAWFGDGRRASGQALYGSLTYGAGGMLGSLLSGVLWDSVGPAWTFTAASLAGAAGLAVLLRTRHLTPRAGSIESAGQQN